jgi:hypothetical protein
MTATKILAAAAVLSTIASTPVFAQEAMSSPGLFSFYHPNEDYLKAGARPAPSTSASGRLRTTNFDGVINSAGDTSCAQRYHSYDPRSGTFLGRDGRRHRCG